MSKSDDNTNELESYGVWVKNSTGGSENTETPADTSDELNLDDVGLDLPDFDDSDFSDMFKDEPEGVDSNPLDDFGSEDDTTLSTDELANITDGFEVEQVDAPAETDDLDLSDFDIPETTEEVSEEVTDAAEDAGEEVSFDTEFTDSTDDLSFDTEITETEETAETSDNDLNFDLGESEVTTEDVSFDIDDSLAVDESEAVPEEVNFETDDTTSEPEEEVSFGDDEEISLDDFMDGGFSDESVAAGNNGYEPGAEPAAVSSNTEELSLDDFMDGDSFESAPAEVKEAEPIVDEAPLDMDISFDDSADTVETEDNVSLDIIDDDIDDETDDSEEVETEEVSLDDFGSSFTAEETTTPSVSSSSENISTEDIDLSDFGIDADAEETPIVQDVEESKNKDKIVDYDLSVGDENTATAPVVNEIKSDTTEEAEEIAEPVEEKPAENANTTSVDNSLLQQIVSELSSLKDEMNKLKSNLAEIKTQENTVNPAAVVAAGAAGIAAGAAVAALSNDDVNPETAEEDKGGFFSEDDGDDTIALSFDELDNIMNTAEFGDTVEAVTESEEEAPAEETVVEEPAIEEPVVDDTISEEPVIEETSVDIDTDSVEAAETEESFDIEEVPVEADDTVIEESIISSEVEPTEITDSVDSEIENAISDETDTSLDDITFDDNQTDDFDFSDEKLEEPKIDEFIPDGNDELYENEELPDEISIPKEDDLLVESTSSDFMDSVKETTEEDETATEFIAEESIEEDTLDLPSELPSELPDTIEEPVEEETVSEEITEEPVIEEETVIDDEPVIEEESAVEETIAEEPVIDEPVIEETVETPVEEAVDETEVIDDDIPTVDKLLSDEPVEEVSSVPSFAEVDNLDNNLSESNLAYLDKQNADGVSDSIANADLKQDIKSVLLYMDQLLENLPEEKIVEFAKSDEFVTYKKLFNELGLS